MQVAQQIRMQIDENWETIVEVPQEPGAEEQNKDAAWAGEGAEWNGNAPSAAGPYGNTAGACPLHVGSCAEPENNVIAFRHTFFRLPALVIKLRQLYGPAEKCGRFERNCGSLL